MDPYMWNVGIDWGTATHQICVMDRAGQRRGERAVDHTAEGIAQASEWILATTTRDPSQIAIAIETPHGALVDTLLERGFAVFAINPKQLDRFRDRHTAAGAKDDRRDAWVLADAVRTDRHAFRRLQVEDARVIQLRELSRLEEDLERDLMRWSNRLRDQIYRVAPALLTLCPAADEPWCWTLVEVATTPAARRALTRTDIRTLLKRHRIRRLTADDVLAQVHAADLTLAPGVIEAAQLQIELLIERLRIGQAQTRRCATRIAALIGDLMGPEPGQEEPAEHRDAAILASLPGAGRKTVATMLAEASRPLADRDYHTLRTSMGTAPITKASGKRRHRAGQPRRYRPLVMMRRACNPRLREAAYHWGRVSIQHDVPSRSYYDRLRARGHGHARALRSVVDRLLRILIAMLNYGTLYDPHRCTVGSKGMATVP